MPEPNRHRLVPLEPVLIYSVSTTPYFVSEPIHAQVEGLEWSEAEAGGHGLIQRQRWTGTINDAGVIATADSIGSLRTALGKALADLRGELELADDASLTTPELKYKRFLMDTLREPPAQS